MDIVCFYQLTTTLQCPLTTHFCIVVLFDKPYNIWTITMCLRHANK